jgi:uncharacterized protein YjbI with pentapeptide repeats
VLGFAGAVLALGLALWLPHHGSDTPSADSDLGSALLGALAVGLAVLLLEHRLDADARARDDAAAVERQRQDARHHAQILVALNRDLTGIDLGDRDLSRFYLRGRTLEGAWLARADLTSANLHHANATGAVLIEVDLEGGYLQAASLRGAALPRATLIGTNLEGADLTAAYLGGADLRQANLREADLRGADFRGAKNLDTCTWTDARYAAGTRLPPGFTPAGALLVAGSDPWRCAGAVQAEAVEPITVIPHLVLWI